MNSSTKDPLLGSAQLLTVLLRILAIFAMVMIGIGIGALLSVGYEDVMAKIAAAKAPKTAYGLLILSFALIMLMLSLAVKFFDELAGIIRSVEEGEPFRADNARRLTRMGWISVGAQALGLVLAMLSKWFGPYLERVGQHADIGFGIELTGILLTLVLFILARVFKHGTDIREELEGTV